MAWKQSKNFHKSKERYFFLDASEHLKEKQTKKQEVPKTLWF